MLNEFVQPPPKLHKDSIPGGYAVALIVLWIKKEVHADPYMREWSACRQKESDSYSRRNPRGSRRA